MAIIDERLLKIVTRFSEASARRSSAPYHAEGIMPETDPDLSGDPSDYEPEIHNTNGTVPADAGIRVTEGIELSSAKLELSNNSIISL